jgi:phosphomannomutase
MAAACAGMAKACGIAVDYYAVLPTPALAFKAMQDKVPAIMVTGSHIPFDRNGLKFYRPDGEITKDDEQKILHAQGLLVAFTPLLPDVNQSGVTNYIQRYLQVFPADSLRGKHIGVYEHSSAGRDLYFKVFEALGAKVTPLERTNTFVPIDTEAVSEDDKRKAKAWSEQHKFDAIFSTDGDGDRPLIADEKGEWLRGDIVGLLCAKALGVDCLAVPVSCNSAIELCGAFRHVVRTQIGSPHVIKAFADMPLHCVGYAGFEANGGFLLGSTIMLNGKALSALPTRDALLPALCLLIAAGDKPLSTLLMALPSRYTASDRLQNVATDWSKAFIAAAVSDPLKALVLLGFKDRVLQSIDQTDGLRMTFVDGDIIHLRPSGNAPELRCYVESESAPQAMQLLNSLYLQLNTIVRN